ncbi:MAG: hypothetical protein AAGG59_03145 [Bacteroidota bacterium]
MSEKIEKLKSKLSGRLHSAKGVIEESKERLVTLAGDLEAVVEEKVDEARGKFSKARKKIKKHQVNLKQSQTEFKEKRTHELAQKRAEYSEKYAKACVEMVFASIEKAEQAMADAILAAREAEELEEV